MKHLHFNILPDPGSKIEGIYYRPPTGTIKQLVYRFTLCNRTVPETEIDWGLSSAFTTLLENITNEGISDIEGQLDIECKDCFRACMALVAEINKAIKESYGNRKLPVLPDDIINDVSGMA